MKKKIYLMLAVMAIASSVYALVQEETTTFCIQGNFGICYQSPTGDGFVCLKGNDPEPNGDCSGDFAKELPIAN